MQIYADVLDREIRISDTDQTAALGSAVYAAVAAGADAGGYSSIQEAVNQMSHLKDYVYHPKVENVERYNRILRYITSLWNFLILRKYILWKKWQNFYRSKYVI